jgi:hypothetical protein
MLAEVELIILIATNCTVSQRAAITIRTVVIRAGRLTGASRSLIAMPSLDRPLQIVTSSRAGQFAPMISHRLPLFLSFHQAKWSRECPSPDKT